MRPTEGPLSEPRTTVTSATIGHLPESEYQHYSPPLPPQWNKISPTSVQQERLSDRVIAVSSIAGTPVYFTLSGQTDCSQTLPSHPLPPSSLSPSHFSVSLYRHLSSRNTSHPTVADCTKPRTPLWARISYKRVAPHRIVLHIKFSESKCQCGRKPPGN